MKFIQLNERYREQPKEVNKIVLQKAVNATSLFFPVVELLSSLSIAILVLWSFLQLDYHQQSHIICGSP